MTNIDNNFIAEILKNLRKRLGRKLLPSEIEVFSCRRSYVAYEMILDYLNDESKPKTEILDYVESIITEYKTANKI